MQTHYEQGTILTMQVFNNKLYYAIPMVVVMYPLQDALFAGTLTRCKFYNQCMWHGSGMIEFKPKSFIPETIEVKYSEVLQNYPHIQFWFNIKWGSKPARILHRFVKNENLHCCLLNHLLNELESDFIQYFDLLSNVANGTLDER